MRRIVVLGLAQEPADRLAGIGDGAGAVVGLAGTSGDDIASVVRFAIAVAVRHFHGHLKTIGKLSVECLRVTRQHRILDRDGAVIIVEHRRAEANRLRKDADSLAERTIGHETSMKGLCHESLPGLQKPADHLVGAAGLFDGDAIVAGIDCWPHLQRFGGPVDAGRLIRAA